MRYYIIQTARQGEKFLYTTRDNHKAQRGFVRKRNRQRGNRKIKHCQFLRDRNTEEDTGEARRNKVATPDAERQAKRTDFYFELKVESGTNKTLYNGEFDPGSG